MNTIHLIDGNNRFRARWEKLGIDALNILYSASNSPTPDTVIIWVWDGKDSKKPRQEILETYKAISAPPTEAFFKTQELFKEVLTHSSCLQLTVDGVEADDVIAHIAKTSKSKILIDSNDKDFLALANERITVNREPIPNVNNDEVRLFKTLFGDKSDGIKGLRGFGEKTWAKLTTEQRSLLQDHFEGNANLTGLDCRDRLGFGKALSNNFDEDLDLLDKYWQVIDFLPVSDDLINMNLKSGKEDPGAVFKLLEPFLLNP